MKFRKRPIVIEAFQWTGGPDQLEDPEWAIDAIKAGLISFHSAGNATFMSIHTQEGTMNAVKYDWIVKGIVGEIYPVKPNIFAATYEIAE